MSMYVKLSLNRWFRCGFESGYLLLFGVLLETDD